MSAVCSRVAGTSDTEAMTKPDEILKNAVENVLADDGFKIQTPSSRSAAEYARKLLRWLSLPNSKEVFYEFAEKLVSDVDRCFDPPKKVRKRGSICGAHLCP